MIGSFDAALFFGMVLFSIPGALMTWFVAAKKYWNNLRLFASVIMVAGGFTFFIKFIEFRNGEHSGVETALWIFLFLVFAVFIRIRYPN